MNRVLSNTALPGGSRLLRLSHASPDVVQPGQWFHLTLDDVSLSLPVLDASPAEHWLAFQAPSELDGPGRGADCQLDGPHGLPIAAPDGLRQLVLITDECGLPAALHAAARDLPVTLVLAGLTSTDAIVRLRPSRFVVTGVDPGAIAGIGALEDAGIPSRLAHPAPLPGCQEGTIDALITSWLHSQSAEQRWHRSVHIIGQTGTVESMQALLRGQVGEHHATSIPLQTSL